MSVKAFRKWAALLATGAIVFQTNSTCVQNAAVVTSASSILTAGGVIYLVFRIATD